MRTTTRLYLVATILQTVLALGGFRPAQAGSGLAYPEARRVDQVDVYHGVEVADPYRWMEEDSEELQAWIDAQTHLLHEYTRATPGYDKLRERIRRIRDFDSYGTPVRAGEHYFYTFTKAGSSTPTLHVQKGLDGKPRTVLDVAAVLADDTRRYGGMTPSPDAQHVVWANQSAGRWGWLEIVRVADGRALNERMHGVAGNSAIWTHDSKGFFYFAYGDTEALQAGVAEPRAQILYHALGTSSRDDRVVFAAGSRPQALFSMKLGDRGRWLVVELFDGTPDVNEVHVVDLADPAWPARVLVAEADARYRFEGNADDTLLFFTTLDAPRGRVVGIDASDSKRKRWTEVLPQRESTLAVVSHIGGKLVVRSTLHARPVVEVFTTRGKRLYELELPSIGLIGGFNDDPEAEVTFYRFNSLYDPGTIYQADLRTGESRLFRRPQLVYDPDDYELRQVFYDSEDGTRVPMFVAHRRGITLDGSNPLFIYGFGSGGWIAFPWFQPHLVAWLDLGGVYALPNIRGGGEYGKEWQNAGTGTNKPNAIDDYIAAVEHLIESGYTSRGRVVANGGSASGVVPAAAVVKRPELFGAALIDFPFLDMLRYHKFTTVKGWTRSYGSSDVREEFEVLYSYSPQHNLKPAVCYPAVLTVIGEEDTSTVPFHGYKFTAALQNRTQCDAPYLLMSIPGAGHYSYGVTPNDQVESQAQMLAFMIRALGLEKTTMELGAR